MIFHIDLDAFFATVEINKRPNLINEPVIICGKSRRTVVSSANYVARNFNIKSGMSIIKAKQMCKNLKIIYLNENSFDEYKEISNKLFSYIKKKYFAVIEMFSIDECFADDIYSLSKVDSQVKLAKKIQMDIKNKFNIRISIGIGENKFLAKMATDINKPYGITFINKKNYKKLLWPIDIENMFMIGKKIAKKLKQIKINTIGDLANFKDKKILKNVLKNNTCMHVNNANAINQKKNNDIINIHELPKSFSINETYEEDITTDEEIISKLKKLTAQNLKKMNQKKYKSKNIGIIVKYCNFKTNIFSNTLNFYTNNINIINNEIIKLYEKNDTNNLPIRMLGVSFKNLLPLNNNNNKNLFNKSKKNTDNKKTEKIIKAVKQNIFDAEIDIAENTLKKTD